VKTAYTIPGHEACAETSDDAAGEPYPIEADGSTEPKAAQPNEAQPKPVQPKAAAPAKPGAKKP